MNQEIKVTKCSECPKFQPFIDNYVIDGLCINNFSIDIYNSNEIHPNCPLKGKTITYKIGENE